MHVTDLDRASIDHVLATTRAARRRLDLDRPVPLEVVHECLELALQAPTGFNQQNWRWLVVTDPDLRAAIGEIYRRIELPFIEMMHAGIPEGVSQAGLIPIAYVTGTDFKRARRRSLRDVLLHERWGRSAALGTVGT